MSFIRSRPPPNVPLSPKLTEMYLIFRIGIEFLFNVGGTFDQIFYINHTGVDQFTADFYPTAGAFKSNYLDTNLKSRGLIDCSYGPELKSFPFYKDAKAIRNSMEDLYVILPSPLCGKKWKN